MYYPLAGDGGDTFDLVREVTDSVSVREFQFETEMAVCVGISPRCRCAYDRRKFSVAGGHHTFPDTAEEVEGCSEFAVPCLEIDTDIECIHGKPGYVEVGQRLRIRPVDPFSSEDISWGVFIVPSFVVGLSSLVCISCHPLVVEVFGIVITGHTVAYTEFQLVDERQGGILEERLF